MTAALEGAGPNTPPHDDGYRGAARHRWTWFGLAAAVIGVAAVAQSGPGRATISRLGLSVEAERFTALSFTAPDALTEPASGHVTASFAIANHEGTSRDYTWTVSVGDGEHGQVVTSGVSHLADAATIVIAPSLTNPCSISDNAETPARRRITVALADPVQSIGFWLTCPTAGGTP